MASQSYTIKCYTGCVLGWAAVKNDVSRDHVPKEYCVGKNGFDGNMTLEEVIDIVAKPVNASLIMKSGPRAKWYVKKVEAKQADTILNGKTTTGERRRGITIDRCYVVTFDEDVSVGKPTTRAMTRAMTHANASRTRKTTAAPALVDVTETKNSVIPSFDMKEVADEVECRRWSGPTMSQKSFTDLMCAIRWAEQSANKMQGWMYPGVKVSQQHQHEQ